PRSKATRSPWPLREGVIEYRLGVGWASTPPPGAAYGEEALTYNRMEAKPIAGEHCRFGGSRQVALVKTRCCEQWICCDTAFMSFRGGGFCQFEHENDSACHFHYHEGHQGWLQNCGERRGQIPGKKYRPLMLAFRRPRSDVEAKYNQILQRVQQQNQPHVEAGRAKSSRELERRLRARRKKDVTHADSG
ncbi:MAG: hypothetical protein O7E52_08060, partial [Candidatus Poribacteria bacterium]|nr:hypothetical protein [Candidatus Poribacteria bacterium]